MYSEIFLCLEPLGIERVAGAARAAGHDVRVLDLQLFSHAELERELDAFRPEAVAFGLNYLANVPEVLDLAKLIRRRLPDCFVFAGGHSVSFIARHVLEQAGGALDAVVRGDGEAVTPLLLATSRDGGARELPGVVTPEGQGRGAPMMLDFDRRLPAGARPHAPTPEVLHRRTRPLRLDRVHARMPVGLLVLLGVDVLRPRLP
jgi:magnesium-protoporphyrin IX monomethyl ester (oxidative) cyclase